MTHQACVRRSARIALLATLAVRTLAAQTAIVRTPASWVGAPVEEYARLLQLTGVMPLASRMIRPMPATQAWTAPDSAPWRAPWAARYGAAARDSSGDSARVHVRVFDGLWQTTFNSAIPYGQNDGALWAGRGLSTQVTAGAAIDAGPVTLQIAPTYTWSQNRAFALGALSNAPATASPYADPFYARSIDKPQRFGDRAVSRLDAGQSAIAVSAYGVRAGWSNESMWWGPGIDNAIMLTNNAPGFNHLHVGTARPANVGIGRLEVLYAMGWMQQSGFWRTAADTFPSDRWLNAVALVFEPKGSPGLYLGAARSFYSYETRNPITPREVLSIFQPFTKKQFVDPANPLGNDTRDQMASVWLRWVFPPVGFEVYGEYGRNDHPFDTRDAVMEPDHSRGYQIGLQKVYPVRGGMLAIRGETTNLTRSVTGQLRAENTWYTHHIVQQGYTERGQVMGAGMGLGGDQQTFAIDWFERRGRIGLTLQRRRDYTDALLARASTLTSPHRRHDVYLEGGPRLTLFAGPVDLDLVYFQQHELNRYLIEHNDVSNSHVELRAQIRP